MNCSYKLRLILSFRNSNYPAPWGVPAVRYSPFFERRRTMRRSKYSEEQIIGILKEHDAGLSTAEVCRKYGVSNATF